MEEKTIKRNYGLFTAIAMIIGIVIGSGIFFKSDNILVATEGNILLGAAVFCIAALSIVFGSLCIAQLAARTDKSGGVISYFEEFCSKRMACSVGWFHLFVYYPALVSVVAYVAGVYFCILFGIEGSLGTEVFVGILFMLLLFGINLLSVKLGGYFQNAATVIKLIPLVVIAVSGLCFAPEQSFAEMTGHIGGSGTWLSAIGPVAFAFDGWIVSTSICHEIRNSKRNLPLALTIAPFAILLAYIAYFVGISLLIGPQQVMELGDSHVYAAAQRLFGDFGAKAILIFIILSVLGTVNGLIMGMIRFPSAMVARSMLPGSSRLKKEAEQGTGPRSILFCLAVCLIWMVLHYLTQRYHLLMNSDVSEIAVAINYLAFIPLYFAVFRLRRKGEIRGNIRGYVLPLLAAAGSLIVVSGSLQNPLFWLYVIFSAAVIVAGAVYWSRFSKRTG